MEGCSSKRSVSPSVATRSTFIRAGRRSQRSSPARINVDRVAIEGLTDLLLQHPSTLVLGYQDMYKQKLYLPWSEKKSDRTILAAGV